MFNRVEFLERTLDRQIGFVRASESRAGFLIPALSLGLAIWLYGFYEADLSRPLVVLCGTLALVGFFLAYYKIWSCFFPRTKGPSHSLIFFGGIAKQTKELYHNEVMSLNETSYCQDLSEQIHINSIIAKE